jgi:hypothetical protein
LLRRPIPGGASHPRSGYSVALGSPVDPPTHALILDAAELVVAAEKARRDLIAGKGDIALVIRLGNLSARSLRRLWLDRPKPAPRKSFIEKMLEREAAEARTAAEAARAAE